MVVDRTLRVVNQEGEQYTFGLGWNCLQATLHRGKLSEMIVRVFDEQGLGSAP